MANEPLFSLLHTSIRPDHDRCVTLRSGRNLTSIWWLARESAILTGHANVSIVHLFTFIRSISQTRAAAGRGHYANHPALRAAAKREAQDPGQERKHLRYGSGVEDLLHTIFNRSATQVECHWMQRTSRCNLHPHGPAVSKINKTIKRRRAARNK